MCADFENQIIGDFMNKYFVLLALPLLAMNVEAKNLSNDPALNLEAVRVLKMTIAGNAMPGPVDSGRAPLVTTIEVEYQTGCAPQGVFAKVEEVDGIQHLSLMVKRDPQIRCFLWDPSPKKAVITSLDFGYRLPVLLENPLLVDQALIY